MTHEPSLADIPPSLFDPVSRLLRCYSVSFIINDELRGSGTLIRYKGMYGILTAWHVVRGFPRGGRLGLPIEERVNNFSLPLESIRVEKVAESNTDIEGPDLAVLILPPVEIDLLKAKMSFFDLAATRERVLGNLHDFRGMWCVCGTPAEMTEEGENCPDGTPTKVFSMACVYGLPVKMEDGKIDAYSDDMGFDYFKFAVNYDHQAGIPLPESFGGVSGGGLWQIPLYQRPKDDAVAYRRDEITLAGVAYYQEPIEKGRDIIRCHFKRSIYEKVCAHLSELA